MKQIPLTQGKVAIVDDEDYDRLSKYRWCTIPSGQTFYAVCYTKPILGTRLSMHREILGARDGEDVHHEDRNGLNNQKRNLRRLTKVQHSSLAEHRFARPKSPDALSKYFGVSWHKKCQKWNAYIHLHHKKIHIGNFLTEDDAARAYNQAAMRIFGSDARLNVIG